MNDIIRTLQFEKEQLEAKNRLLQDKIESYNRQISEHDHELRQAKRLLKAAVEDIHDVLSSQIKITNYTLCEKCKHYLNCNCKDKCIARYNLKQWRYADEALKLIGGSENG